MVLGYITVIGGLMIAPLAIILGHRNERRKRELEHIERMHALENGRSLPQDEPWWSPMRIALFIGGMVPLGIFFSVGVATYASGYHESMWIAATMVGTASVITGTILAGQSLSRAETSDKLALTKPEVYEDAYDIVGTRG